MGKHKNSTQSSMIVEFMENYPDIAKGFTKRDKPSVEALWNELADSLNGTGPPQKDANGWKKTWTEWKSEIKRKLAKNKAESRATGGGPYSKYQLTQTEKTIVRICGIAQSVEGVIGVAVGLPEDATVNICDEEMPSQPDKRPLPPLPAYNTPKRQKVQNSEVLKEYLDEDNKIKLELNQSLQELINIQKENSSSLRRVYRAIEKNNETVANAIHEIKDEFTRVSGMILHTMQEKNKIKQKQLDLDLLKFEYQKKHDK